ncbi:MAG: hypothetical protein HY940_05470 [Gammaproteobacteria bacterium]|nr:hypothetical protein [Gammaproteobacteria bacterium]
MNRGSGQQDSIPSDISGQLMALDVDEDQLAANDDDGAELHINASARKRIEQMAERRRLRRDLENFQHFNI